jgi:GT2 family glycosyltransferase
VHDLAIIIVSTNEADWLQPCLQSILDHAGPINLDLVVADNESTDGTRQLVESRFPDVRVVTCSNRGFAHGNNRALQTCDARYVLFLNPDTQIVSGTFAELLDRVDRRPDVGVVGIRQISPDGTLHPTMRRFPTVFRAVGDALGLERLSFRPGWLGERELDLARYEHEFALDWTIGSFMLVRREAIESAGFMDERFFVYSEETDFCLRIRRAGWRILHDPSMTIVHHVRKGNKARKVDDRMVQQNAFAQLQYARKNFRGLYGIAYHAALVLRYALRALPPAGSPERRRASAAAVRLLLGRDIPPFGQPPTQAVALAEWRIEQASEPEQGAR